MADDIPNTVIDDILVIFIDFDTNEDEARKNDTFRFDNTLSGLQEAIKQTTLEHSNQKWYYISILNQAESVRAKNAPIYAIQHLHNNAWTTLTVASRSQEFKSILWYMARNTGKASDIRKLISKDLQKKAVFSKMVGYGLDDKIFS